MTPELMQALTYLAIAAGGYAVRHFNLLSIVAPQSQSGTTPASPATPSTTSAHPVLDRILQILNQAADDALTQAAQQVVSQPTKPAPANVAKS
jgi:hypothetical protein